MLELPRFTAAAVQTSPAFLDPDATTAKAVDLIAEAAGNGASLIAFPEVFVPGYPYWNWVLSPVEGSPWFERLYRAAIEVPGPEVERLCAAARRHGVTVVIGVNERGRYSTGVIYNTLLTISAKGELLGAHRKLVPTWAEKLTWTGGDGSSLRVHETELGRIGVLACGENTNTLARFSLLAQGEQVHVAAYIALPVAPEDYDMADAIAIRTAAHAFEGKVFSVVATSTISPEMVDTIAGDSQKIRDLLARKRNALSGVFGPDGRPVSEPLIDAEGIVYGEIDIGRSIQAKQMHDIIGHYNRFDVFQLHQNTTPQQPLVLSGPFQQEPVSPAPDAAGEDTD